MRRRARPTAGPAADRRGRAGAGRAAHAGVTGAAAAGRRHEQERSARKRRKLELTAGAPPGAALAACQPRPTAASRSATRNGRQPAGRARLPDPRRPLAAEKASHNLRIRLKISSVCTPMAMDAVEGLAEVVRQQRSSSCGRSPRPTAGRAWPVLWSGWLPASSRSRPPQRRRGDCDGMAAALLGSSRPEDETRCQSQKWATAALTWTKPPGS